MKKINFLSAMMLLILVFLLFSPGLFAEEVAASNVIVDEDGQSIEFVYREDGENVPGVFVDIPDNAWYNLYVSYLKQVDLVNGVSETEFAPQQNITRSEFVKLISLLSAENTDAYTMSVSFADGNTGDWYHPYEEWAAANSIVEGDDQNNFNGDEYITREEAIAILYRFSQSYSEHIFDGDTPVIEISFDDEAQISAWALDAVNAMAKIGVIAGYEGNFNPQSYITRAEAAKVIADYRIFDQRPMILCQDSSTVEYLEAEENSSLDESLVEESETFDGGFTGEVTTVGDVPMLTIREDPGITVSWATSNHASMLNRSFSILALDNIQGNTPAYVHNLSTSVGALSSSGKISTTAQGYIRAGSTVPDTEETSGNTFVRHYYKYDSNGGVGTTKTGSHSDTAFQWFNDHYYWAKCEYAVGNYQTAYNELGRSIHYLEDINAPHHAMLKTTTNSNHSQYESWVKNNFYSEYWEWGTAAASYPYVCNSTFLAMSNSFSKSACDHYTACEYFQSNPSTAKTATAELTKRTQRAVAGLLYRFLVDTGRAN